MVVFTLIENKQHSNRREPPWDCSARCLARESTHTWKTLAPPPGAVVLDVRSPEEFVDGHIDGARNVPVSHIQNAPRQVPALDTPLFVYCLSGARSAQACRFLTQMGYTTVTNMGGINRWSGPVKQGRI